MSSSQPYSPLLPRIFVAILLSLTFMLGLVWRFSSLYQRINFHQMSHYLLGLQGHSWTLFAIMGIFMAGGLLCFVHVVLLWATVFSFDPWHAVLYCEVGSIASALLVYGLGRVLRPGVVRKLAGSFLGRVSEALGKKGKTTIILLHWFPICPFSILNLLAGSTHIRFIDYMIGTLIGITPGIIFISFFGGQVRRAILFPHWQSFVIVILFVVVAFVVLRIAHRLILKKSS